MRRPCLSPDCPALVEGGARCGPCEAAYQRKRNSAPERQAYRDPAYRAIPLGGVCHICGEPGADTRDHVVPLRHGGSNDASNIRPAHRACNSGRGAKGLGGVTPPARAPPARGARLKDS